MTPEPIRLVCFDLGGVIVRICRDWSHACSVAGLDLRGDWSNGIPASERWRELSRQFSLGELDHEVWRTELCTLLGHCYSTSEIEHVHRSWLLGEYGGVCSLIDRIHEAGLVTASLSNTDPAHWKQLMTYPAIAKLHHPLASHLLRHLKPDPAIYRAFEQQVGLRGRQILFFDDLPENVAAARNLGWIARQINPDQCTATQIEEVLQELKLLGHLR